MVAGISAYKKTTEIVYKQDELPTKELEAQLDSKPVLQLNAIYGTPKPKPTLPYGVHNVNDYYIVGYGDEYEIGRAHVWTPVT